MKFCVPPRQYRLVPTGIGVLSLLGIIESAQAQTTIHATGVAGISYTDNLYSAPRDPGPNTAPRVSTFYLTLTPGLALYHNRERSRFLLQYSHPFIFYLGNSRLNINGDLASGQGYWALSPNDELFLGLNASRMTTAAALGTAAAGQGASAVTDTRARLLTLGANEQWSHTFDERWRGRQFINAMRTETLSGPTLQPTRYTATAGLGADYTFERDALGLQSSATYFWMSYVPTFLAAPAFPVPGSTPIQTRSTMSRRQVILDNFGRYRRDLSAAWSAEARLGVSSAFNLESSSFVGPRWGASVLWRTEDISASLNYDRLVTANTMTGFSYQSDLVMLSFGAPLRLAPNLTFAASSGVSQNRFLTAQQDLGSVRTIVWTTNAGLNYAPNEVLPQFSLSYVHFEQFSRGEGTAVPPEFGRNTISLLVSGQFPPRTFYEVPGGPPQRVDRGDRGPAVTRGMQTPGGPAPSRSGGY